MGSFNPHTVVSHCIGIGFTVPTSVFNQRKLFFWHLMLNFTVKLSILKVSLNKSRTYLRLNHVASPISHSTDKIENIHGFLCSYSLQLSEECNEGACSPNTSTAVDDHRTILQGVFLHDLAHKVQELGGILWHTVVWPNGEVKLPDYSLCLIPFFLQRKGANGVLSQDESFLEINMVRRVECWCP